MKMIHETLFNLWNNPGDVNNTEEWKSHLLELHMFLHPGEEKLLQKIIAIALDYHRIVAFNEQILNPSHMQEGDQNNDKVPSGFYVEAFCNGVHKVLEGYRKEILKLEDMFLEYPQLPLTFILCCVEKFRSLFEMLKSMIYEIQTENLHGCLLMDRLHKYIGCGLEQIEKAAEKIIQSINTVFYQHLCNWIVCGDLVDTCNEFFICDGKVPDEDFLYPEQIAELESKDQSVFKKTKIRRPPTVRKFFINWSMVPMFISEDTAESILFMGRIVWIVRNDPKKSSDTDYQIQFKRDIWEEKDTEYYTKLQALESQSFNAVEFKKTVEECRLKLTKYLWSLMLDEGKLIEHLQLIRDYYALGRGELFQQFITVAESHMKDISTEGIIQHLNFIFHETARKIYGENDKTYLRFELTSSNVETKTNPWLRLQINFEINWPLHIVFHPKVMELYNKLFCYLLRLKKTQIDLHKLWSQHVSSKQNIDKRIWTLRQNLMFLVNNLQYYLQVDVIEAQFSLLLKAVQNANEFEDIIKVHHDFVSNLLARTFVLTPDMSHNYKNKHSLYQSPALQLNVPSKVYIAITKLLEVCDEFCLAANLWQPVLTSLQAEEYEVLKRKSDGATESLLFILYSLHEKISGEHLLQLLLQLDFNRYFSKNKIDFSLSIA